MHYFFPLMIFNLQTFIIFCVVVSFTTCRTLLEMRRRLIRHESSFMQLVVHRVLSFHSYCHRELSYLVNWPLYSFFLISDMDSQTSTHLSGSHSWAIGFLNEEYIYFWLYFGFKWILFLCSILTVLFLDLQNQQHLHKAFKIC